MPRKSKSTKDVEKMRFVLVFVGAINWGLVGGFDYNLVTTLFGAGSTLTTVTYVIVGLAGVYCGFVYFKHCSECKQ